ncbi:3-ketoacyl-ACP reductase [Streptomyces sp. Act143]|uniref:SDR family oxidoreductase n=1 Tax=Streptomyces sp. Act143 TaxID=2200760 RepID=UPI000D6745ED|nr:SDR family oxidoreductase [Streptomyces sp. Act143]PWI15801.1 3-ketoacyl-ACP reductase [Streptomyces sp. Act143]
MNTSTHHQGADAVPKKLRGMGAIVTGGSRGIGRSVVERLVADGARVAFSYLSGAEPAAELERTAAAGGGAAKGFRADLAEPDAVRGFLAAAREWLGGFDILVNNAGCVVPALLAETADEDFDRVMAVNATAVFLALREAARHMRDGGRIITVSTINTRLAVPGAAVYAGSKGAIEQFTAVAALELGSRGITANTVSPGFTDTDLLRSANSEETLRQAAALSPFGRLGEPSDIADVVAFLAGPDGRWVSGQNLCVDGAVNGLYR